MSIHALLLQGWDETSTWGVDDGLYYAQLTRNGVSDADGPQIWIAPPQYVVRGVTELMYTIAASTGAPVDVVDEAMSRGLAVGRGERVATVVPPTPSVPSGPAGDLSTAIAGQGVTREATRRRMTEGAGADRSWRVGADGEAVVGALLAELTEPSLWDRIRRRRPPWRVMHSVPLGDGRGNERGDIDHVVLGPPGVVTINTKHHRTGKLVLDGDELVLNGRRTDYVPKARREAQRADQLIRAAMDRSVPAINRRIPARSMIVIVGGRLVTREWATGVLVVRTDRLLHTLHALPQALDSDQVDVMFDLIRRRDTWNPPGP